MIDYRMCFSPAGVYTVTKTSSVENNEWKNDMAVNMATFFATGLLWRTSFLNNRNPRTRNLVYEEIQFFL